MIENILTVGTWGLVVVGFFVMLEWTIRGLLRIVTMWTIRSAQRRCTVFVCKNRRRPGSDVCDVHAHYERKVGQSS